MGLAKKNFARAVLITGAATAAVSLSGCGVMDYSEGDRVGTVTKISQKGVLCKTWEGELATDNFKDIRDSDGNVTGSSNTFEFSVKEDTPEIVQQLKDAQQAGVRVDLHYTQVAPGHNPCTSDTSYYITKVSTLAPKPR